LILKLKVMAPGDYILHQIKETLKPIPVGYYQL